MTRPAEVATSSTCQAGFLSLRITRPRSWSAATRPRVTALNADTFTSSGFSARGVRRNLWRRSRVTHQLGSARSCGATTTTASRGSAMVAWTIPAPPRCSTRLKWRSCATVSEPPPDGGLWTGRKVACWISGRIGRTVSPQRGVEYLRRLDLTRQVPRPANPKASLYEQARFKKSSRTRQRAPRLRHGDPGRGLGVRRTPPRPETDPAQGLGARGCADRQWPSPLRVALSVRLRPARHGRSRVVHRRWRQHRAVQRAPGVVRRRGGDGPDKHVILVLDGAGWHVAKDLVVPEGVELMFLPPYSPQIQPAERLWPLTNEPIVNEYFETLEELDEVLAERCRILADDPDQIKAHTLFEWWPHHN